MKFVRLHQWVMRDVSEISLEAFAWKLDCHADFKAAEYDRRRPVGNQLLPPFVLLKTAWPLMLT